MLGYLIYNNFNGRVGRNGGLNGINLHNDIMQGGWVLFDYRTHPDPVLPNHNWFTADQFRQRVNELIGAEAAQAAVAAAIANAGLPIVQPQQQLPKQPTINLIRQQIITLIGNQSPSDRNEFIKRRRFHQGWWRACKLGENPGPHPSVAGATICNTINNGQANNKNFLHPLVITAIADTLGERAEWLAQGRPIAGIIEQDRLHNNLLSSQPLCFNFFGVLKYNLDLATKLFSKFYPVIGTVTGIFFEFVPDFRGGTFNTNDNSAFDVAIEFTSIDNESGIIAIECKFTEPFAQIVHNNPNYVQIYNDAEGTFIADYNDFMNNAFNQLFRNDLIVEASVLNNTYDIGLSGLFCHQDDNNAMQTGNNYQAMLLNGANRFKVITMRSFIEGIQKLDLDWGLREWSMMLWARYLGTGLSEAFYG